MTLYVQTKSFSHHAKSLLAKGRRELSIQYWKTETLKEAKSLLAKGGRELSVQHWKTVTLEEAKSLLAKGGRELCLTCQEQLC